MTFLHFRYRNRLGLLASSLLEAGEADWVLSHAADCDSCRNELAELEETRLRLVADAAIDRPLPISSAALQTRVLARIREASLQPSPQPSLLKDEGRMFRLPAALTAAGLVGAGLVAGVLVTKLAPSPSESMPRVETMAATVADTTANDAAFYDRLEKTHLRANAARYLAEAQDVLVQVTAAADCPDSPVDSVDVAREAQTSRTLLTRRAALVSGSGETLTAARGVMEEVEGLLQEVADLPKCTRRIDVDAIARRVDRRNLLMKIDMVSQELVAP